MSSPMPAPDSPPTTEEWVQIIKDAGEKLKENEKHAFDPAPVYYNQAEADSLGIKHGEIYRIGLVRWVQVVITKPLTVDHW